MNDEVTYRALGVEGAEIVCDIAKIGVGFIWQIAPHIAMSGAAFATGCVHAVPPFIGQLVTGAVSFGSGMVTGAVTFGSGMVTKITNMVSVVKIFQAFHESMPKETTIPHAPYNATISEQAKMEKAKEKLAADTDKTVDVLAFLIAYIMEINWPGTFVLVFPLIKFILKYFIRTREQGTKNTDPPTLVEKKPRTPPKNGKPRSARAKSPSKSQSQVQKRKTK